MKKRFYVITATLMLLLALMVALPAFAAQIQASSDPASLSGTGDATLSLRIVNDGSSTIDNISISNANGLSFDTAGVSIPAGSDHTFSKRVTVPYELLGRSIEFSVSYSEGGESKSGKASVTIALNGAADGTTATPDPLTGAVPTPGTAASTAQITATRSVSASQASPGDEITVKYVLTNTGVTEVRGISITDKDIGGKAAMAKDIVIAAGQSYTYEHKFTMGSTTLTSAPVISYVGADGVTVINVTVAEKVIGMVNTKLTFTVEQGTPTAEGVAFTLFLTNNGNQKISKLKIVDEQNNTVASDFALAIGENKSVTYTVPTDEQRNVVFYVTGVDATNESYADNSQVFEVRKYIDPSMIGVDFSATVIETLNAGSIRVLFTVTNTGTLTMTDLVLSEEQIGDIYNKESLSAGTENIEQNVYIGEPRELTFTLAMKDPAGNPFTYTAYISADYVGVDASDFSAEPATTNIDTDIIDEVGSTISDTLRTILIVLAILTVIACIALLVLTNLERAERRRIARRRAQRERMREQAHQTSNYLTSGEKPRLVNGAPAGAETSHRQDTTVRTERPASPRPASPRPASTRPASPRPTSTPRPASQQTTTTRTVREASPDVTRANRERTPAQRRPSGDTQAATRRSTGDIQATAHRTTGDTQGTMRTPRPRPQSVDGKSTDATQRLPRKPEN